MLFERGSLSRRGFMTNSVAALTAAGLPLWYAKEVFGADAATAATAAKATSANSKLRVGFIGIGSPQSRNYALYGAAKRFKHVDCAAICDVDLRHVDRAVNTFLSDGYTPRVYKDFRQVNASKEIDAVCIATPDHWHALVAIDALRNGKDVYCEKPLTLTVEEALLLQKVVKETGRVLQTGSQQRSEMGGMFRLAAEVVRAGRIGKVKRIECRINGNPQSGAIAVAEVPKELDWDMWLGPTPSVPYRLKDGKTNCHYEFRWWYDYSGGKMTDWGAHHVDIASWALGIDESGPMTVEGVAKHPCEFKDGHPLRDDCYNAATSFDVTVMCPGDVELHIVSESKDGNGILFEGSEGRFHVSRERMKGKPVEDLKEKPLSEELLLKLYKGKKPGNHMGNFFECIADRTDPISDVYSHHRAMTTCHLANIAIRLGRKITWDSKTEQIVGDPAANQWLAREQRKGYEIDVSV